MEAGHGFAKSRAGRNVRRIFKWKGRRGVIERYTGLVLGRGGCRVGDLGRRRVAEGRAATTPRRPTRSAVRFRPAGKEDHQRRPANE